jgi:hypothetical protein
MWVSSDVMLCMSYQKEVSGLEVKSVYHNPTVYLVLCALLQAPGKLLLAVWCPAATHLLLSLHSALHPE